jgi:hypothetical protein
MAITHSACHFSLQLGLINYFNLHVRATYFRMVITREEKQEKLKVKSEEKQKGPQPTQLLEQNPVQNPVQITVASPSSMPVNLTGNLAMQSCP